MLHSVQQTLCSFRAGYFGSGPRRRTRRPGVEALEARLALSLGVEVPGTVNTAVAGPQYDASNASAGNGRSVVVWTDASASPNRVIHAQRLQSGVKVNTVQRIITTVSAKDF